MNRVNDYELKGVFSLNQVVSVELPIGIQIIDIHGHYPSSESVTLRVIEDSDVEKVKRNFVVFGCNGVPENVDGYRHVKTFRNGTFVSYLFEVIPQEPVVETVGISEERCGECGRKLCRPSHPFCEQKDSHAKPDKAQKIVAEIEDDLTDRRGLRQEFEGCDNDTQDEIRDTWAEIIWKHLRGP